jgi:hypothetical protein
MSSGDPALDTLLTAALASDPSERPDARSLASALRSAFPTQAIDLPLVPVPPTRDPNGSTQKLPIISEPAISESEEPRHRMLLTIAIVAMAALSVTVLAMSAGDPESLLASSTTTFPIQASTAATTTTATTTTVDPVGSALAVIAGALDALEPSQLKPKDAREIQRKIDEAVVAAGQGESDLAQTKLEEAAQKVINELDGEDRDRVLAALCDIAAALGVNLDLSDLDGD